MSAGLASWCAPTPTHCQTWGGDALVGAVPSFRFGDRPYRVIVRRQDDPSRFVIVTIVSNCACGEHVIDLSPAAFRKLAPQSVGEVAVSIEDIRPGITPPATDP